jgi:hypothetical protein
MSLVWDKMIPLSQTMLDTLEQSTDDELKYTAEQGKGYLWENYIFTSRNYRRAHVEIVDAREAKKIWVMHMTIFPELDDPTPIFGFDVVCGANKITGAFHDFSKNGNCDLYTWFIDRSSKLEWNKPRVLPDWATQIFSPGMIAAGNISEEEELDKLSDLAIESLHVYLYNVGCIEKTGISYKERYNNYCKFQKMNPHTPAMMINLGIDETVFRNFMDEILFPEIE